jgi:hypothetical protein
MLAQSSSPGASPAPGTSPVQDPARLQHASAPESFAELIGGSGHGHTLPAADPPVMVDPVQSVVFDPHQPAVFDTLRPAALPATQPATFDPVADAPFHAHGATQADVREKDIRYDDPRRGNETTLVSRPDAVAVSTQTGRVRLRPDELARVTDSAPVPVTLPTASTTDELSALFGGMPVAEAPASVPSSRRGARTAAGASRGKAKASKAMVAKTKPMRVKPTKAAPVDTKPAKAGTRPEKRAKATRARIAVRASRGRRSLLSRLLAKAGIMVAALGLVATTAVPAYAQFDTRTWVDPSTGKAQTLAVGSVQSVALDKDDYAAHTTSAALDSTMGTVVAPEVQALAQQLMSAVQAGRLVGSTPDHIFEIRYLAEGRAVPGCGVDYRVLQAISFALTQFTTVGVSDINRHCTGQIEGAGTASAHYADGGGHAVDFYRLNGQALSGGDSASIKLIEALDKVVPTNSTVGQMECRSSLPLTHFKEIDDTCDHVHVDFLDAKGATLLG